MRFTVLCLMAMVACASACWGNNCGNNVDNVANTKIDNHLSGNNGETLLANGVVNNMGNDVRGGNNWNPGNNAVSNKMNTAINNDVHNNNGKTVVLNGVNNNVGNVVGKKGCSSC